MSLYGPVPRRHLFGGMSGDILYSSTDSNYTNEYTNVEAELETYSLSASAQLLGQYQSTTIEVVCEKISWCQSSDAKFWVKPALNLSYSKEYLIDQKFTSNTSLGRTIVSSKYSNASGHKSHARA